MRRNPTFIGAALVLASALPLRSGDLDPPSPLAQLPTPPKVVALQTANPSCPDDSDDIFVSCGNGTVTDNRTGLVWLANADCFGELDWYEALEAVATLGDEGIYRGWASPCGPEIDPDECDCGLSDHSSPGEWRLPTIAELRGLVWPAYQLGCNPAMTTDSGTSCWNAIWCQVPGRCSFYNVQQDDYLSSTSWGKKSHTLEVWKILLDTTNNPAAFGGVGPKVSPGRVWPVRGGQ